MPPESTRFPEGPSLESGSGRLYSLDLLRTVAAAAVVVQHWQVLFWTGNGKPAIDPARLPFAPVLGDVYRFGYLAVDLFFCLSGFVFFWLYRGRIQAREVSWARFWQLRFARLYPLHLATLLLVAFLQAGVRAWTGRPFLETVNDSYHFILNLGFASAWGFERSPSFNTPIWSVSVEILLYLAFFVLCTVRRSGWVWCLMAIGIGLGVQKLGQDQIGRGLISFFLGGLVYHLATRVGRSTAQARSRWLAFALLFWVPVSLWNWKANIGYTVWSRTGLGLSLGRDYVGAALLIFREHTLVWLVWPGLIFALVLLERWRGHLGRRWAIAGDLTYSIYLLHFPLLLAVWAGLRVLGISRDVFYEGWTLLTFFLALTGCSLFVFTCYERPMRDWIRGFGRIHRVRGETA